MSDSTEFVMRHPALAQGYLLTAQTSLEAALRIVSATIGGLHVALPVWVGRDAPPERVTSAMSSVKDAIPQLLKAVQALDAMGVRARGVDGLCACDAYSHNHRPEHGCPRR